MNCFIVKPIFESVASDNCLINENTTTTTFETESSFLWLPPCAQKFFYRDHTGAGELMCWVRRVCQWRSVQKYTDHQDQRTSLPCGSQQSLRPRLTLERLQWYMIIVIIIIIIIIIMWLWHPKVQNKQNGYALRLKLEAGEPDASNRSWVSHRSQGSNSIALIQARGCLLEEIR